MIIVTTFAACALTFIYIKLVFDVIKLRRKHKVSIGDGGRDDLAIAIRTQANLIEYAPIALILMSFLELNGAPIWLCAVLALTFVLGRLLHPFGMTGSNAMNMRVRGMQLTLLAIVLLVISNLVLLVWQFLAAS